MFDLTSLIRKFKAEFIIGIVMPRDFTQGPALGQINEKQYVKGMIIFQWVKVEKCKKLKK